MCNVFQGLVSEAPGPTLIDLKARTKSSYEEVSTALTGMQVGYLIGDIVGGALVDKFSLYCELMLALSLDLIAGATIAIPWVPRTEFIWILCCVQGIGGGILNTGRVMHIDCGFGKCLHLRFEHYKKEHFF